LQALDTEAKGYLDVEVMRKLLSEVGPVPFREKELEAFFKTAVDKSSGRIYYEDYVALMAK
jgi:Ca2+-binding EF-hand superfamily protein